MSGEAPCPGCGVVLPEYDGPTHPYIGASPACWALYGELLAQEYTDLGYPECHRMTVDAYAVQHPGRRDGRSIRSVGLHLCGLYLVFERGLDGPAATAAKNEILATDPRFAWLRPPPQDQALTIQDVLETRTDIRHCDAIETWAGSVWRSWEIHQGTVAGWVEEAFEKIGQQSQRQV